MELNKNSWIVVWVLIFLGWFAYLNNLSNLFVYDDYLLVLDNPAIKSFQHIIDIFKHDIYYYVSQSNFYRPIVSLSLMFDFFVWRLMPVGYHVTNNLLHIFNGVFLFFILRKIFKDSVLALMVSVLFILHPIHTQAVTYVSGRADPLYVFFAFIAILFFLKSEGENKPLIFGAYSFFILSLLSKEVALIIPFLILLILKTFYKNGKLNKYLFGFFLICIVYVLIRLTLLRSILHNPGPMPLDFGVRLMNLPKQITEYAVLLILPLNLHIERAIPVSLRFFKELNIVIFPPQVNIVNPDYPLILSWIFLIMVIVFLLKIAKKNKGVFFSGAWFLVALLPVSNLFSINALIAEHWLYLPSVGFFILLSLGLLKLSQVSIFCKYIFLFLFCSLILGYFYLTHERNKDWRNEVVFYKNILEYTPKNQGMRIHYNLGCAYLDAGQIDEAIKEYETAISIKPRDNLLAYFNLARAYLIKNDFDRAKYLLGIAVRTTPKNINDDRVIKQAQSLLEKINKPKLK